jgi:hypothetical protein
MELTDERLVRLIHNDPIAHRAHALAVAEGWTVEKMLVEMVLAMAARHEELMHDKLQP